MHSVPYVAPCRLRPYYTQFTRPPVLSILSDSTELIARVKQGDASALAECFSLHRQRLWRMVHFRMDPRLHGRVDADDVLQEGYLAAAARVEHFREDSSTSLFIWLRMIVSQTLVDVHRRHIEAQKRDARREVASHPRRGAHGTSVSIARQLLGQLTSPSHAAMRAEVAEQLEKALETMNEIDREVLALRHFEELTNSEIAAVLGIEQKAASIRYVRAIKRLKDILAELPGFADDGEFS